jgi:hypothetical protein
MREISKEQTIQDLGSGSQPWFHIRIICELLKGVGRNKAPEQLNQTLSRGREPEQGPGYWSFLKLPGDSKVDNLWPLAYSDDQQATVIAVY